MAKINQYLVVSKYLISIVSKLICMKSLFTLLFVFATSSLLLAQSEYCGSVGLTKSINDNLQLYSDFNRKKPASNPVSRLNSVNDTIPVVVHVVNNFGSTVITDNDIIDLIARLNRDLAKNNADTIDIPTAFKPLAGSVPFRFMLAKRNYDGAMTNGIVRVNSTHPPFNNTILDVMDIQSNSTGGSDNWINCFNIYITEIAGVRGFASLGNDPVVLDYTAISSASRIITHEVGHAFNLNHIWGSSSSAGTCNDDDNISDTPVQWGPTIAATFPKFDSCTTTGNGIMFMNYMDYSYPVFMFSLEQTAEMTNRYNNYYRNLTNSYSLQDVYANDGGCPEIVYPQGSVCTEFNPIVKIRNWGYNTMTSLEVKYRFDNSTLKSYTWTGSLSNYQTDDIVLPLENLLPGNHTLVAYTVNPNGNADADNSNDTLEMSFFIASGELLPINQGFETGIFPPQGWGTTVGNPANRNWSDTTIASYSGSSSMYYYDRNSTSWTSNAEVTFLANINFAVNPSLTFYVANAIGNGLSDTLEVYVSDDCGINFDLLYRKFGSALVTGTTSSQHFIPTHSQWRKDSINLSSYSGTSVPLTIKFNVINGWANELYIDDINITSTNIGTDDFNIDNTIVYPNPSEGFIRIQNVNSNNKLIISDIQNKIFLEKNIFGNEMVDISRLANGVYFISIDNGKSVIRKKIILH